MLSQSNLQKENTINYLKEILNSNFMGGKKCFSGLKVQETVVCCRICGENSGNKREKCGFLEEKVVDFEIRS